MAAPGGEFLRELTAAPARASGSDDPARNLMRLADDPLELNLFLHRGERAPGARAGGIRLPMLDLAAPAASGGMPGGCRGYGVAEAHEVNSLAPEAFEPSEEDVAQAFTVGPEPGQRIPVSSGRRWQVMTMGAAAVILLIVLILR